MPTFKSSADENLLQQIQIAETIQYYDPWADTFGCAKETELNGLITRKI